MKARFILQYHRESERGIVRMPGVPDAPTFLEPSRHYMGRIIDTAVGGCSIRAF